MRHNVLILSIFFSLWIIASNADETQDKKFTIEWRSKNSGLYSNLMKVVEWIYCVKENGGHFCLYVNMKYAYSCPENLFSVLFKKVDDPQIITAPINPIFFRTQKFPLVYKSFSKYPTDGMKNYQDSQYVYLDPKLYTDPDFSLFRNRLHPIILKYLQPVSHLEEKIDNTVLKMNIASENLSQPSYKIGIHIRGQMHYQGCRQEKSAAQFMDDLENDIEQIMESKDPKTTVIFLATLVEPLVERLSRKYNIVTCDICRTPDATTDWDRIQGTRNIDAASDAVADLWCLSKCDEIWGSSSNMMVFLGCLNPTLPIYMLPSLKNYYGY